MLVPVGGPRRWHWQRRPEPRPDETAGRGTPALIGVSAITLARIQMSVIYFQSCVAKLPHAEWADGSALYYWINNYAFGAPGWLRPALNSVVDNPLGVAALTWGPLVLEIVLAGALLLPQRVRWMLLPVGVLFHLGIAVVMGLWSFAFAMWAGLLLLLTPYVHDPRLSPPRRRKTAAAAAVPVLVAAKPRDAEQPVHN